MHGFFVVRCCDRVHPDFEGGIYVAEICAGGRGFSVLRARCEQAWRERDRVLAHCWTAPAIWIPLARTAAPTSIRASDALLAPVGGRPSGHVPVRPLFSVDIVNSPTGTRAHYVGARRAYITLSVRTDRRGDSWTPAPVEGPCARQGWT